MVEQKPVARATNWFADLSIILTVLLGLFVVINTAAWLYLNADKSVGGNWYRKLQINPNSAEGMALRRMVFDTDDDELLRRLEQPPSLRPHTILNFTSGVSTEAYTVGIQGMRYGPGWDDAKAQAALASSSSNYVMGGSTTFGHGVEDGDTLVAKLAAMQPASTFLNFGTNAYDSLREIDKLVYMLRQGYRPKTVIFIDGLNDITTFMQSPYGAHDKPRTEGYIINRGAGAMTFGYPQPRNMLRALAYAMPITHLFVKQQKGDRSRAYGSLDPNITPVNLNDLSYYYDNRFEFGYQNLDVMIDDWLSYYQENIAFVQKLADKFGFEATHVWQPLGVLDRRNPFILQEHFDGITWEIFVEFDRRVREEIANGTLGMIDCADAFDDIDGQMAYVDPTHYSPLGNQALATCVSAAMD